MEATIEETPQFHGLGDEAYKQREYQTAVEAYSKAIDIDFYDHFLYMKRAACYFRLNKFEQCIKDCEAALGMDDRMIEAWMIKGEICTLLRDFKKANSCTENIRVLSLQVKDQHDELKRLNKVERNMISAIIAVINKEYSKALIKMEKIFRRYPNLVVTEYIELLLKTDNVEEALQISDKFSNRFMTQSRFLYTKGLALHYSGDSSDAAQKIWTKARELSPLDSELIYALKKLKKQEERHKKGMKALKEEEYELAIACFVEAIDQDPFHQVIVNALHYNIAFANFKLKKYVETISDCSKVIEMNIVDADAFLLRARAKLKINQREAAIADSIIADELDPSLHARRQIESYQRSHTSQSQPKRNQYQPYFIKLNAINYHLIANFVNVVALIVKVGNPWKVGIDKKLMREVTLCDDTGIELKLVLWGDRAEEFSARERTLISIGGAKVTSFRGTIQLTCYNQTGLIRSKPNLTSLLRVKELENWWKKINKANGADIYDENGFDSFPMPRPLRFSSSSYSAFDQDYWADRRRRNQEAYLNYNRGREYHPLDSYYDNLRANGF